MYTNDVYFYCKHCSIIGLQQFASALQNEQGQGSSQSGDKDKDSGKKSDSEEKKPDKDQQGTE